MLVSRQKEWLLYSRRALIAVMVALGLAFVAAPVQAAIRYVDIDGGVNAGNCTDSGNACGTITYAIGQAIAGDDIYVAKGSYTEPQITVNKQVTITGGFNPDGPTLWATTNYTFTPTILDGQETNRPLQITADGVALQYMTVRNGNADTAAPFVTYGGGILVNDAQNVLLRGLNVTENVASTSNVNSIGGGIAVVGNSKLTIERTLVLSNSTSALGGGIGLRPGTNDDVFITIRSSVIARNAALEGGALSTSGTERSVITILHTTFADNNISNGSGAADEAIFMTGGDAVSANSLDISYSLLKGNNTAVDSNLTKVPIMLSTGLLMDPNVINDWQGNVPVLNPAVRRALPFVNPAAGDYHLSPASPAIDIAGNTAKTDLEGRERVNSANCTPFTLCPMGRSDDYGAYEYVYTAPSVRYVANEGNKTLNNCLNPDLPCGTLEDANFLALGGDEVRVAHGTYSGGDGLCANQAVLCVRQGITVTGGFTLTNWNTPSTNPALTIIDGADTRQGIQVDYDAASGSSLIRNVTVRNGTSLTHGGGIAINNQNIGPAQNLTLRNCRVENNDAGSGDGGGIYAKEPVNLRVENCTLANNYVADGRGGGIAIADATGLSTYTLTSLVVYGNWANRPNDMSANGGMGGGVFLQGIGTLRQSEIYSNTAAFSGGGVTTGSNNAHPIVDRVYIHDNKAGLGGGFSIFVTGGANLQNSLLVRNVATSTVGLLTGQTTDPMMGGNAIHSPYIGLPEEPLRVINVTIADNVGAVNDAVTVEGTANPAASRRNFFTNVLISGNDVGIRSDGEGFAELVKVLMINNVTTPTDNFDATRLTGTPLSGNIGFVGGGNYRLLPGADGVDDGDTVPGITQDLDGVSRPVGPAFDIGAFETTLQKQNQSITFAELPNRALADSPFTVSPTASSNLPVQLTSLTPAVCTVSGTTVTLVTVGTCSLQASQPGNATFNPAPSVTRSFAIGVDVPQETLHLPVLEKQ